MCLVDGAVWHLIVQVAERVNNPYMHLAQIDVL